MIWAIRLAPYLAVAGLVFWVMDMRADLATERAENAALERELATVNKQIALQRIAAAEAQHARDEAQAALADTRATIDTILKEGLGHDDPLDPALRDLLNQRLCRATGADRPDFCAD